MRNNNILKTIMIVLFAGAIVFGVYWLTNNSKKVVASMNGTNIYTYEDVQKSYSDGYNTALENKSEYDTLIASYRDTITTLNNNINTLNSQITTLQNTISTKNGDISELQAQITTLQTQKTNLESQITTLDGYIASLQSEIENVYNYTYDLDITFIVDGSTYTTGKARNGGTILVPPTEPTKSGYVFSGWSYTANGTVVDLSTEVITTNTTFYAIFQVYTITITFFESRSSDCWISTLVYDDYSIDRMASQISVGNQIGTFSSADGTISVSPSTERICIKISSTDNISIFGSVNVTGGVSYVECLNFGCYEYLFFNISGSGSISISSVELDF